MPPIEAHVPVQARSTTAPSAAASTLSTKHLRLLLLQHGSTQPTNPTVHQAAAAILLCSLQCKKPTLLLQQREVKRQILVTTLEHLAENTFFSARPAEGDRHKA
jgi:hypothetical protein